MRHGVQSEPPHFLESLLQPFKYSAMSQILKHRSGSLARKKTETDFIRLLKESYDYLRSHEYRVLSTELPDDLLKKWLMPNPDNSDASKYMRNFARQNNTLSETFLPAFVFDYVLKNRYGRDIATFGGKDMEDAAADLRSYILLLNYIFGMREAGRTLIEFDIFDVENYDAITERIEAQEQRAEHPTEQERLSDGDLIAIRNQVFGDLMDSYFDEIMIVLKEYLSIDISRCEEVLLRVVDRDMAHFDMNPELSMRDNSRDMFVDTIEYRDGESFTLHLTEADIHMDDLVKNPFRWWRKIRRTAVSHRIVIRRGGCMTAPFITPTTFFLLKNTVKRYDACERGLHKKAGVMNWREQKANVTEFMNDISKAADRHGIDMKKVMNNL